MIAVLLVSALVWKVDVGMGGFVCAVILAVSGLAVPFLAGVPPIGLAVVALSEVSVTRVAASRAAFLAGVAPLAVLAALIVSAGT